MARYFAYYLSLTKHEFYIPKEYTMKDHTKLVDILWDCKSEYKKLELTMVKKPYRVANSRALKGIKRISM